MRVIEVPYETDNARFEKIEAQVQALKYPIKDIYDKLENLQKAEILEKDTREKVDTVLQKSIEKAEQCIIAEEEQRIAIEGPIHDNIKVLQAKFKNL